MRPTTFFVASVLVLTPFLTAAQQDAPQGDHPQAAPGPNAESRTRIEVRPGEPRPRIHMEPAGEPLTWEEERVEIQRLRDTARTMYEALDNNPEIVAIRAEIQAAQARLQQIEMKIATEYVAKQRERDALIRKLDHERELVDREFAAPESLLPLQAQLEALNAELKYMSGRQPVIIRTNGDVTFSPAPVAPELASRMKPESRPALEEGATDELLSTLRAQTNLVFSEAPLEEIADFISDMHDINMNTDIQLRGTPVTVNLKDVTLEQGLTAIADAHDVAFIVRDYGIFATFRNRASSFAGPSIPEGIPYRDPDAPRAPFAIAPLEGRHVERIKVDKVPVERIEREVRIEVAPRAVEQPAPAPPPAPAPTPDR